MKLIKNFQPGLSLVEILVATALLLSLTSGLISLTQLSVRSNQATREREEAYLVLRETMEAALAVRASNFANLSEGSFYPQIVEGKWTLISGDQQLGNVRRWLEITHVQRLVSCAGERVCEIVDSGGVVDPVTFRAKAFVEWAELGETKQANLESFLTFWR